MVLPFLPIAAGIGGGLLGGLLLGGKKGKAATTTTTTYHPYAFYQPTVSKQIQYPSYQFIMDSPFADQAATKKQAVTQTPTIMAPITPTAAGVGAAASPPSAGASLMPFVLVGGAVLIGYTVLTKPKSSSGRKAPQR